jgi:leader peptidase (prepilin peptidase)/N-methyltransferase
VTLSGVLGAYTGWLGWDIWAVGLVAGFLAGGLFGVLLLATGRANRKTKVPFGPFMIFGALLAVFAGEAIAEVWLGT